MCNTIINKTTYFCLTGAVNPGTGTASKGWLKNARDECKRNPKFRTDGMNILQVFAISRNSFTKNNEILFLQQKIEEEWYNICMRNRNKNTSR